MIQEQAIQRLNWLDEEHRKDKTLMNEILKQLDQHLTQITGVARNLQDLEERLARVQSQSLRYSQIEQVLGQVRTEVQMQFDQLNQRIQQREEDAQKLRQQERERFDKTVETLHAKIEEVAQLHKHSAVDREALKRVEGGQFAFVRGLEELSKRQEGMNTRIQVAEEGTKRMGALIAEIQQLGERLRQDRADALEATRRADQLRARQVAEWNEQVKVTRREMDDWLAQLRPLLDLPKETRGYLATLRELETQLKQIEPRLTQRQKLNEDISRREAVALKAEMEKFFQQQANDWEFMRDEWSKKITALSQRFDPIDEWRAATFEEFRQLREKIDADRPRYVNILADVVRMQVDYARAANARFDQFANDLLTRVETEKAPAKVKKAA